MSLRGTGSHVCVDRHPLEAWGAFPEQGEASAIIYSGDEKQAFHMLYILKFWVREGNY